MLRIIIFCLALVYSSKSKAQTFYGPEPFAHTYSIVAMDSIAGEMGVAVQSHWFSVGSIVSWGEAGVGVIATQSFVNPAYGQKGLQLLKMGYDAKQTLKFLLENDPGEAVRQVAILDVKGNVAVHTGKNCIQAAGHTYGDGYSIQANLMENDKVWPSMEKSFLSNNHLPLAERMLAAMEAGENEGGDIRGKQSVAILVVKLKGTGQSWVDRTVDLRIADHKEPLKEMKRLLQVHRAYEHMNKGDLAVEHNNFDEALKEYSAAESLYPENIEMKYWHAISLLNIGKQDKGIPMLESIFLKNRKWHTLTLRLKDNGLLIVSDELFKKISEM